MRTWELRTRIRLPRPRAEVFGYFGDAGNLQEITPPWLHFRIVTPQPIGMRPGALIEYRLRLHGIPIRWRTRIVVWHPPNHFVDVQLRGPYALWEHTHTFVPDGEHAVVIRDRVRYALPFGAVGRLAHTLFVRRDLERIFDYRRRAVDYAVAR